MRRTQLIIVFDAILFIIKTKMNPIEQYRCDGEPYTLFEM
jgi:hypothetical protein